jgi:hypothetical protein
MRTNRLIIKENYRSILLISSCLFGIAGINPARVNAYCQLTTDSNEPGECADTGLPLYWTCNNITYSVCPRDIGTPPFTEVTTVIEDSFQTWADVECSEGPIGFEFIRNKNPKECDEHWKVKENSDSDFSPDENLIIFVSEWNDYYPRESSAFALTSVWHSVKTGVIQGFDMELNEDIGTFGICNRAKMRSCEDIVDIQNVVTHEAGHVLGLGHSIDETAAMSSSSQIGDTSMRTLKKDDVDGICSIYEDNLPTYCSASTRKKSTGDFFSCRATHGKNTDDWILYALSVSVLLIYRRRREQQSKKPL